MVCNVRVHEPADVLDIFCTRRFWLFNFGWLVGLGFICQKHIEGPTYPHLGKVGQLVNIQWYSFMPLLVVLLAFVFFCIPSFISVAVLQTGMLHPPDAGRGASPRVFHFVFLLFMCWFFLFVLFSSFVFLHSWLGWVTYILHL